MSDNARDLRDICAVEPTDRGYAVILYSADGQQFTLSTHKSATNAAAIAHRVALLVQTWMNT